MTFVEAGVGVRGDARLPGAPRALDKRSRTARAARLAHRRCCWAVAGTVTWNRLEDAVHNSGSEAAVRRADQRAVGDRRACDERRRGRPHAGLSHVVELVPRFVGARVHVRVRVRLPAVALDLRAVSRRRRRLVEPILDMLRAGSWITRPSRRARARSRGSAVLAPRLDAIEQLVVEAEALAGLREQRVTRSSSRATRTGIPVRRCDWAPPSRQRRLVAHARPPPRPQSASASNRSAASLCAFSARREPRALLNLGTFRKSASLHRVKSGRILP